MVSAGETGLSRRRLIAGTTAAGVGLALPMVAAAEATPAASPAALDAAVVLRVSQAVVGGGTLDEAAVPPLVDLLAGEPGSAAAIAELAAIPDMTPEALEAASADAKAVAANILSYWYQGQFNGKPAPNRAGIFFSLVSWQALPYMTQPTLCKAFGYWAADVMPS
ncbi:MAG: sugar dehydrogenase complex small subunit [Thermomicrobiales bacterium]